MTVTASQIGEHLRKLVANAEARAAEADQLADRLAKAKRAYKEAHAKIKTEQIMGGCSAAHADALADLDTGKELEEYTLAEQLSRISPEHVRIAREAISAGQTEAGWHRMEWEAEHKGPRVRT